jgi:hypothetical protein
VLDGGFRKAMKNVNDWLTNIYSNIYSIPQFVAVMGKVQMCAKALKPVCVADPVKVVAKKVEEKPAA